MNKFVPLLFAALVASAALAPSVSAQPYPNKPIRLLVGLPPGAGPDVEARQFAAQLAIELGQPVVVDNRPGGAQLLALEALAKSPADGYTLAVGQPSNLAANLRLYDRPSFDVEKDLMPVSLLAEHPWLLYINAKLPAKTLAEFIALAREKPGDITYATTGVGSYQHITAEWFQKLTGTKLKHVPYGATSWQNDLVAGHVDATFYPLITLAEHVKAGKLRALAISGKERSALLPDVPTFAEAGVPEYTVRAWFGLVAPAGTPAPIIEQLANSSARAAATTGFREFMGKNGAIAVGSSQADFDRHLKVERVRWRGVISDANIKLD
jgi:tripartite-type tricarboxylate transporter receptor subunit TctC